MGASISHCDDDTDNTQVEQQEAGETVAASVAETAITAAGEVAEAADEEPEAATEIAVEAAAEEAAGGEAAEAAAAAEEEEEEEEEEEPKPEIKLGTAPPDMRFPHTNQIRHCYARYNEFHRCAAEKDPESNECKFYQKAYRSLCPAEWVEQWNEERENGTFPGRF